MALAAFFFFSIFHQGKVDDQMNWRVRQNEKLVNLREKLRRSKEQLAQGWLIVWQLLIYYAPLTFDSKIDLL